MQRIGSGTMVPGVSVPVNIPAGKSAQRSNRPFIMDIDAAQINEITPRELGATQAEFGQRLRNDAYNSVVQHPPQGPTTEQINFDLPEGMPVAERLTYKIYKDRMANNLEGTFITPNAPAYSSDFNKTFNTVRNMQGPLKSNVSKPNVNMSWDNGESVIADRPEPKSSRAAARLAAKREEQAPVFRGQRSGNDLTGIFPVSTRPKPGVTGIDPLRIQMFEPFTEMDANVPANNSEFGWLDTEQLRELLRRSVMADMQNTNVGSDDGLMVPYDVSTWSPPTY